MLLSEEKRFFSCNNDMWRSIELYRSGESLNEKGSKIVLTIRKIGFPLAKSHSRECKGLPLAIIATAGAMAHHAY